MEGSHLPKHRRSVTRPAKHMPETAKAVSGAPTIYPGPVRRNALVVETEPATLQLCREVLEHFGFEVDTVDSGIAAVIVTRERLPDLILINLQLRDVPGQEAIEWLRSNPVLRSTPIIVLASSAEDDVGLATIQPGTLLRKPVSAIAIQSAIWKVLK